MPVVRHRGNAEFVARASPWLSRREAANNLPLGIADALANDPERYPDPYLATLEDGAEVAGVALMTPPHDLIVTDVDPAWLPRIADDVEAAGRDLPGVLGPTATAEAFAHLWAERRGVATSQAMAMRIYALRAVTPPRDPAPGRLRPVGPDEVDRFAAWYEGFARDAHAPLAAGADPRAQVRRHVASGGLHCWEDGGRVVAMACATGPTPSGIRIGLVYTPRELRGRGYATAAVAALSQRQLGAGRRFCFLFTDLDDPTSNSIYARVGYRPVADWSAHRFA